MAFIQQIIPAREKCKACFFLYIVLNLVTFSASACRTRIGTLDDVTPDELEATHCLREHLKIREARAPEDVLYLAEILASKGALDGDSLRRQAEAYKALGLAEEALEAYIKSTKTETICKYFQDIENTCKRTVSQDFNLYDIDERNFYEAKQNFELASYFHAAGRHEEGDEIFKKGKKMMEVFEMQCRNSYEVTYILNQCSQDNSQDKCLGSKKLENDEKDAISDECHRIAFPDGDAIK
jgi:tetratricopeptide (TPR) repeat protein